MAKEKNEQKSLAQEGVVQQAVADNIGQNGNRALLWAIFGALVVLIGLVVTVAAVSILRPVKNAEVSKQENVVDKKDSPEDNSLVNQGLDEAVIAKPPTAPAQNIDNNRVFPKKSCKAKKFDGKKYDDGESYTTKDGCETCECNDGKWNCKVKDSCIILPSDCTFDNKIYHDKDTRSADCDQTCTCDNHIWKCEMDPTSSCCKDTDGKIYHNGESFPKDCNTCTCNNGSINCTMMLCI